MNQIPAIISHPPQSVGVPTDKRSASSAAGGAQKARPTALDARTRLLLARSAQARKEKELWFARGVARHIDDATPWRTHEVPLSHRRTHKADFRSLMFTAAILFAIFALVKAL